MFLGGKEVRAKYFGRGHTSGDAIVYFPDLKVVHTGDLFLGRRAPSPGRDGAPPRPRPAGVNIYVDYAQGGSFFDWTKTLDGALTLDFDTVIPGHGPLSTKADVVQFRADIETMRTRLAGHDQAGQDEGRHGEHARSRLRLAGEGMSSESSDSRMSSVSAIRRDVRGVEARGTVRLK